MYEIKLGTYYNRRSTLSKVGRSGWPVTHWKATLDCKKVIPFYISWGNGKVQVGKGKDRILSLNDNTVPPINDVTVEAGDDELYLIIQEGMLICRTDLCVYMKLLLIGISNVHILTPTFFIKTQNLSSYNNTKQIFTRVEAIYPAMSICDETLHQSDIAPNLQCYRNISVDHRPTFFFHKHVWRISHSLKRHLTFKSCSPVTLGTCIWST